MTRRSLLNFHEIFEYQHSVLLGNEGLYLPRVVSLNQFPKGIYCYYLQKSRRNGFYSFSKKNERKTVGMFFTKKEIQFNENICYIEDPKDFEIFEKLQSPNEFFDFFQMKLSLDRQISLADERRKEEPEDEEDADSNHLFIGKQGQY